MSKPFKTFEEQIEILNSRGICTDDGSVHILMRENYYSVVNGYKDFFLDDTEDRDSFKQGTKLLDIYTLFLLDRELKFLFLRHILAVEANMKTLIAYRSSEEYKNNQEFYLEKSTYTTKTEHTDGVHKLIEKLRKQKDADKPSLNHYKTVHGNVPLWVLVNMLTFGSISYLYKLLESRGAKQKVVNDIKELYKQEYGNTLKLTVEKLERDLWVLVDFRNVCAHDERFYCHKCKRINVQPNQPADAVYLLGILLDYLSKADFDSLENELNSLFVTFAHNKKLSLEIVEKVLYSLGFRRRRSETK